MYTKCEQCYARVRKRYYNQSGAGLNLSFGTLQEDEI